MLNGKVVLVTGGTGSFGQTFVRYVLDRYRPKKLIVFSRDELKQFEMAEKFSKNQYPPLRYFLGDVRDKDRLYRAFDGVDYVVHAAALKQVPACEYNPLEAIKTNILGAANVVDAAIDRRVKKVIALSTDKAANPINLYGATKLCADKLFGAANLYAGGQESKFSIVRYGNVMGSRGSVIPIFIDKARAGQPLPITDARMTRFWITLEQGVEFVAKSLERMQGGEVFVPKLPSLKIMDLAKAIAPESEVEKVGIRPGEKLHEVMISADDAHRTWELNDHYMILPDHFGAAAVAKLASSQAVTPCEDGFEYRSDNNSQWLSIDHLKAIIAEITAS